MNTLIIGGTGFVGSHMLAQSPSWSSTTVVGSDVDVRDKKALNRLFQRIKPAYIVNLAAITTVKETIASPRENYDVIFYGTLNILEVLRDNKFAGTFLYVSSSEVYGHPSDVTLPLLENSILSPMSPYAVGKIAAEYLCLYWQKNSDMNVVVARPFTHIGPGQSDRFSISSFAKQISQIMLGKKNPVIKVGNLDTTRDFTDVRDIVVAYWLLLKDGKYGEIYNVCSENEVKVRSILQNLINLSGRKITIEIDSERVRSSEQKRVLGCSKKLQEATGWERKIEITDTLTSMLNYWLEKGS